MLPCTRAIARHNGHSELRLRMPRTILRSSRQQMPRGQSPTPYRRFEHIEDRLAQTRDELYTLWEQLLQLERRVDKRVPPPCKPKKRTRRTKK